MTSSEQARLMEAHRAYAASCNRECGGKAAGWCEQVLRSAGIVELPAVCDAAREWLRGWRESGEATAMLPFETETAASEFRNAVKLHGLLNEDERFVMGHRRFCVYKPGALEAGKAGLMAAQRIVQAHTGGEFLAGWRFPDGGTAAVFALNLRQAVSGEGGGMRCAKRGDCVLLWKEG